ncbi:uncharacterized protein isoform X1 [Danio rerio]|uniref:Uncharacterized protein isoform X1 n=2 Tax=Danio rerio TaxID=7955 RepID=A0A8M1RKR5_DANRE|nr:uncharacterized protein LOC100330743 isoform X2 [Danio rerio]|eukprot:XP_002665043.1 uncharacterized protein LOC100330743 isoform X2 [Danio rerio]
MWSNSQSVPRSPEHRDVSSPKRQMKVSVKSVSYFLPVSDLNANADRSSSDLSHSWSSSVRMDTSTPLHQHEVVCSNLTVLKLRHVPVKPAEKQKFTDGHGLPKRRGVRSHKHMMEVSLKDISYLSCEPDLNASVDHSSSLLLHSESREERMDKRRPLRHHPAPRSKLPILKSKCVPVKPVNQQSFTDEPSEWMGVDLNQKGSQSVRLDKCKPIRHHPAAPRSKLPILKSKCVPVKPVNQQSFTDEPSEWLGVDSNHIMKGSQSVRMKKRRPLRHHPDAPRSKLPILKTKCVPVKPVNQQSFTDEPAEWLDVGSNHIMKGRQPVRMDKRTSLRKHPVAGRSKLPVLESKCVPVKPVSGQKFTDGPPEHQMKVSLKDPPCESELNVSVECSSSLLAVRVGKSQHPAAVSTHSPVLRRRCAPVKLLSRQKIIDEAPERQVSRFPPLVNKAERNGADPSCGSDCKVESRLSLPSLPRLTSGVKVDEHVPLPVPVFTNLPTLKPAHVAMRPALPSNFMFFPLDNDVKMKRTRSITRSPSLLSRFHSATYF